MTSLVPRPPYSDEELRRLYPAGLQLQFVQVLMRHGERTPVSARFENAGLRPFWPYCSALRQFRAAVLANDGDGGVAGGGAATGPLATFPWRRRLETFGGGDEAVPAKGPRGELDALCDMGMLTDVGRATTLRLGRRLRQLYVDRLGFLPAALRPGDADRLFYLRTTPVPRALESLQQAFTGLYPEVLSDALPPVTILSRAPDDETLFPNDGNCRRFAELSRAFAQRAADRWNDSPELAHVTAQIGRWLPPGSPRVAVGGKPRLSGIMDTINATLAHGPDTRLPAAFYDEQARRNIARVAIEEWFDGYRESLEYRTLGIGGLMGDLVARMVQQTEATSATSAAPTTPAPSAAAHTPPVFALHGCHDTTLAAILSSLGTKMAAWPPFTSHLALEMFHDPAVPPVAVAPAPAGWWPFSSAPVATGIGRKPTPDLSDDEKHRLDGYYVRIRYNDEPVTVPGCRLPGNHLAGDESFCTLAAFKAVVDKFTPHNWKLECRSNRGAPAVPSTPEPSGY